MVEIKLKLTVEEAFELLKFLEKTGIGSKENCCVKNILKADGETNPPKPPK
jgi:hypothetical protein